MKYVIQALSWGSDLVTPDAKEHKEQDLDDAKVIMSKHWSNPECFHVRILKPFHSDFPCLEYDLHCMRSRPTKDTYLRHFFEKIKAVPGVKTHEPGDEINVLRVKDIYYQRPPVNGLYLPAHEFCYEMSGSAAAIDPLALSTGSDALQLDRFETCLAAAAFFPSGMNSILGVKTDRSWEFLSEVDVEGEKAKLTFSTMRLGIDFTEEDE